MWDNRNSKNESGDAVFAGNQYSTPGMHTVRVCADGSSLTQPPLLCAAVCDPQGTTPTQESWSIPTCPSQTSTYCTKCKGNSSHQAYGFITLLNTRNTACEVSRKILGSRNPEQLMFSLPFPPELNVDDNFHTAKESVMVRPVLWQWYFDHSPTKLGVSLISPARKYYMWGHTVSKIFSSYTLSAQPTPGAALPVVLLECFGLLLRRRLRRGTGKMLDRSQRHRVDGKVSRRSSNGQCHWSVGCIA